MSALQTRLPGATVLDLFAGTGALGLEALSRGAAHVVFVERSTVAIRALRRNVAILGADSDVEVVRGDAVSYSQALEEGSFDIALADPPYGAGLASDLLDRHLEFPFARELWVEHRWSEPVPAFPSLRTRRYGDTALTTSIACE